MVSGWVCAWQGENRHAQARSDGKWASSGKTVALRRACAQDTRNDDVNRSGRDGRGAGGADQCGRNRCAQPKLGVRLRDSARSGRGAREIDAGACRGHGQRRHCISTAGKQARTGGGGVGRWFQGGCAHGRAKIGMRKREVMENGQAAAKLQRCGVRVHRIHAMMM